MLTSSRFPHHCAQLVDPKITPEARITLATEIRDSIELVHSQEYTSFLDNFLPAFKVVLSVLTQPQQADNTVHKTRALILEILNRLPHNDVLRARILDVFTMAMDTLKNDNEENAVTAIRIIFDLHKNYRHHLSGQVQPFLDFVRRLYKSFGKTVEALLLIDTTSRLSGQPIQHRIASSSQSFKVLTECPLLVMFVFQLYPNLISTNIQHLLPLMVQAIQYEVSVQVLPTAPKNAFHEFIAAQVKTVSFLAYLLKQFPDLMKSDEMSIPRSVVKLMQTCPGGSVHIRKELLVATRHILTSPFRRGFFDQIDLLLDERVLVGTGRAATDTLRPLAYSFLAELVHCVRLSLSIPQLEKIIFLFSTNVHDPKFSYTLQTSSVRLLLNLIEGILKVDPANISQRSAARELLIRILETMVTKYVTLGDQVPRLLRSVETLRSTEDPVKSGKRLCEVPVGDPLKEIADFKSLLKTLTLGLKTVIWSAINIRVQQPNVNASGSTYAAGLPTNLADKSKPQHSQLSSSNRPSMRTGLLEKECEIVSRLLSAGQKCFQLYSRHEKANGASQDTLPPTSSSRNKGRDYINVKQRADAAEHFSQLLQSSQIDTVVAASPLEEREVFDQFAQIFTVLDPPSFQDVFGLRISDLFDYIVDNPAAITIPQHFLANSGVSKYFADILFNFLVENLSKLDVPTQQQECKKSKDGRRATYLLKLFKILFASVSLFPANEPVLRLHLTPIVRNCLKCAARAQDPHGYLQMLRALFKSITNGTHEVQVELLYRDFIPLVEPLFSALLSLYEGPCRLALKELIIELCLMIPARPSTIFPHLEQQIKPIVWALEGGRDNPTYGLRTLEFWVDMLQPAYLEILLARVEPDLTRALHKHLKPPGNSFGSAALRILGKLGSRSRSHIALTMPFKAKSDSECAQKMFLRWPDGVGLFLDTDKLVHLSANAVMDRRLQNSAKTTLEHKVEAWKFLFVCLCPFLGIRSCVSSNSSKSTDEYSSNGLWDLFSNPESIMEGMESDTSSRRLRTEYIKKAEENLVTTMLVALISALGIPGFLEAFANIDKSVGPKRTPSELMNGLCKYFALVTVQDSGRRIRNESSSSCAQLGDGDVVGTKVLSYSLFLDSVVEVMSLERSDHASAGLKCLEQYLFALFKYSAISSAKPQSDGPSLLISHTAQNLSHLTNKVTANPLDVQADAMQIDSGSCPTPPGPSPSDHVEPATGGKIDMDTGKPVNSEKHDSFLLNDERVMASSLAPVLDRLCHCCHQRTWSAKWAGVNGLECLIAGISTSILVSSNFAVTHLQVQVVRALLFSTRDSLDPAGNATVIQGRELLFKLLKLCFEQSEEELKRAKPKSLAYSNSLKAITGRITRELMCESSNARETARRCFGVLGASLQCDVADILSPFKDHILRPLQQRAVRQHPLPVQIGYLEAVNFCLQLEKPLIASDLFSSPLRENFLIESMYILDGNNVDPATEAEEGFRHKYHENKYYDAKTTRQLLYLRRKVLELLCNVSVHCSNNLLEAQNERLFRGMISCFFRSLQSRDDEIVQSAKRGLKQGISKHERPKDLLQRNLRPILGNLADYKKLTIPYLQGLSRVLELFSHWFNVNLGEKLLEHLQRWTEPEKIAPLKKMMPGTESRVAAAILDLFHLLPADASKFLEKIVRMVLRLESVLALAAPGAAHLGLKNRKGASTSPYRAPLLKYCNQHAGVAAKFFLSHLDDEKMRQLFFVMIRTEDSAALREELRGSPKRLLSGPHFPVEGTGNITLHIFSLIDLLSTHKPEWLGSDPEILSKLITYWKVASNVSELRQHNALALSRVNEVKTIAEIFIRYCTHFKKEINLLFELLPVFSTRTICDFTFVKDFLQRTVTRAGPLPNRKAVVTKFLSMFQSKNLSQERKVHALQYIVIPMISHYLSHLSESEGIAKLSTAAGSTNTAKEQSEKRTEGGVEGGDSRQGKGVSIAGKEGCANIPNRIPQEGAPGKHGTTADGCIVGAEAKASGTSNGQGPSSTETSEPKDKQDDVLDAGLIERIMKELLDQSDEVLRFYDEPLSAEMLRLATILIRFMPKELGSYRKELIKFGWNHLKREDSIAKHWAFVNVSRFFEAYNAPVKIILQVYVALLRACQGEGKDLVQQALDILTPALPRRLTHNPSDHKYPIWIRYTKKILLEEGHSIPNLVHIWQLIARHSSLFYVARAQFVPIMVNSLNRIGLNTTTPVENRRLALDLVALILQWERRRRKITECHGDREPIAEGSAKKRLKENEEVPSYTNVLRGRENEKEIQMNTGKNSDSTPTNKGRESIPEAVGKKRGREEETHTKEEDLTSARAHDTDKEPPAKTRKSSDASPVVVAASPIPSNASAARESDDFKPGGGMVDVLVNFLVQVPFRPMDRRETPLITRRCIKLLEEALRLWPDASVRLAFVEKLLAPLPQEKGGGSVTQQGNKAASVSAALDFGAQDGKSNVRSDSQKNDKTEHARLKRNATRHAALTTTLLLCSVLVKYCGRRFVEVNINAIRSLIIPAVSENVKSAAVQFSSLLSDIFRVLPVSSLQLSLQTDVLRQSTSAAQKNSLKGETSALHGAEYNVAMGKEASCGSNSLAPKGLGTDEEWVVNLFKDVNRGIEQSLKSNDAARNQCGLIVLQSFLRGAPREFLKYQDLLAKMLHRMTKENLSTGQPSGPGSSGGLGQGTPASGIPRVHNTTDKNTSTAAGSGQTRNAASSGSGLIADPAKALESARTSKSAAIEEDQQNSNEMQALVLCVSLMGENISTLEPSQRKPLFHLLWALIERCFQVEILLQIVRVVRNWVFWKPRGSRSPVGAKEPVTSKEKVQFLIKMVVFERITGGGSQELMTSYLHIILKIFGGDGAAEKRPELLAKLERAFMLGLKTVDRPMRQRFFQIYDAAVGSSLTVRLNYIIAKQEWEHLSSTLWIKHATELLISAVSKDQALHDHANHDRSRFPTLAQASANIPKDVVLSSSLNCSDPALKQSYKQSYKQNAFISDMDLFNFEKYVNSLQVGSFVMSLRNLLHVDSEIAYETWVNLFHKIWDTLGSNERMSMEKSMAILLTKEYHQSQMSWARSNMQALFDAVVLCQPLPPIRPDVVAHLGMRWNLWHTSLYYLETRKSAVKEALSSSGGVVDERVESRYLAELEDIADAQIRLFESLNERDYIAGIWKERGNSNLTSRALCLEQVGLYGHAQDIYAEALSDQLDAPSTTELAKQLCLPGKTEINFWEDRWIDCARSLCQWEVLTEFSRTVANSKLLHECLWRLPDWSALKELLIKNPVEDGPQLKLYQAYVQLQENRLDLADNFITQGYHKVQEKFCALPESADMDASAPILVQFQQLVELQESGRILSELNALSRHGSSNINVEQKIDNVRLILNTWRERLPSQHESLRVWNDILTWRNHVHAVVVNVLDALKEAASAKVAAAQGPSSSGNGGNRSAGLTAQAAQVQAAAAIAQALPQQVLVMGVNETAWNVHRFAKACRKQGYPEVALYVLQKLYPFGTMELSEYFIKTKETARSYMAGPKGLDKNIESGLHELSRCNMDHFNPRQKAQLFTVKGKLYSALGQEDDAIEAFCTALHTSPDVGSAWLAWGRHCDMMQNNASTDPSSFSSFPIRVDEGKNPNEASAENSNSFAAELAFREAAVNCYLQAARFGSRKTRAFLPRVLRLLSTDLYCRSAHNVVNPAEENVQMSTDRPAMMDVEKSGTPLSSNVSKVGVSTVQSSKSSPIPEMKERKKDKTGSSLSENGVSKVLGSLILDIPAWMWLPWLSQIVQMLSRKEGIIVRPILMRIAQQYPQAIFFPIRAFMEKRRPLDRPTKLSSEEALKLGRPIAPALRSAASPAHLNTAARHLQSAQENVQRATIKCRSLQKDLVKIEKIIASSEGAPDDSANKTKRDQIKNELITTHRVFEKYLSALQAAKQRQRQIQESIPGGYEIDKQSSTQRSPAEASPTSGSVSSEGKQSQRQKDAPARNDAGIAASKSQSSLAKKPLRERVTSTGSVEIVGTPFDQADQVMTQIVKSHQLLYLDTEKIAYELSYRMKSQPEEHLLSLMNALLHRCYQCQMKARKEIAPSFRSALEEASRMCFGTGQDIRAVEARVQSRITDLKTSFEAELAPQTSKDFPTDLEPFIARLRRWQKIFQRRIDSLPEFLKLESISRHLLEINDSDVEVFGQYVDVEMSEPSTDRHVKIKQFCADVRILQRPSGPSRGIRIIGSNGQFYNFVLETSIIANVQMTEDRTAQMYRLLNSCIFAKDSEAHRRRIHLTVPVLIATGARCRLVSDDINLSSLAEGLEKYLKEHGKNSDDVILKFRNLAFKAHKRIKTVPDKRNLSDVIAARIEAYHSVCKDEVPDTCLSSWVRSRMTGAGNNFMFQKRFGETLGTASIVSYSLAIGARRPRNILFSWSTGAVHNLHMRVLTSPKGIFESDEAVPFRLTRNVRRLLGPFGLQGPFFGSMVTTLYTLSKNQEVLRVYLDFVMRDEVVGWVNSSKAAGGRGKARGGVDSNGGSVKDDYTRVEECLAASVDAIMGRLRCGTDKKGKEGTLREETEDMGRNVNNLIEKACEPENLAQMESSWQAWY